MMGVLPRQLLLLTAFLIAGILGGACAKYPSFYKKPGQRTFFMVPRHVPDGSLTDKQVAGLKAWENWLIEERGGYERLGSEIKGWETADMGPHFDEDRTYIIVMHDGDKDVFHESLIKFMGGEYEEQEVSIEP
ncbi:MAG: hypothetical protein JJU11_00710 [Candidatus Sumerlaeia bacterium]|nr:hypothetical protein [Candidatus Sumerlaeia bacterium]